jgi:hypothetical protein
MTTAAASRARGADLDDPRRPLVVLATAVKARRGLAQSTQVGPFLWECSYKRLKMAQLLGQLGVFLT